jgi:SAM-dependent methyltransferase
MPRKKRFNRCAELEHVWPELQAWYASGLGEQLAAYEQDLVQTALTNLFGYYLVQIGRLNAADWLATSRISQRLVVDFPGASGAMMSLPNLLSQPHGLPLRSDSVDVVVLPHVLEFSQYPHEVLREVERVLIPEGHVILLAFNPWSLWGARRHMLPWQRHTAPWCARFLSTTRLKDWLALLGFEVQTVQGYFYRPPFKHDSLLQRPGVWERAGQRCWPVLGASNLLVARKRVTTITPIRPRWAPQQIIPAGLKPSQNRQRVYRQHDD